VQSNNGVRFVVGEELDKNGKVVPGTSFTVTSAVATIGEDDVWWEWTGGSGFQTPVQLPETRIIQPYIGDGPPRLSARLEAFFSIRSFLLTNPLCNEIIGKDLLSAFADSNYVIPQGENDPVLDKTIKELKITNKSPFPLTKMDNDTLRDNWIGNYGVTIGNTIYLLSEASKLRVFSHQRIITWVHETMHRGRKVRNFSEAYSHAAWGNVYGKSMGNWKPNSRLSLKQLNAYGDAGFDKWIENGCAPLISPTMSSGN
jgi:hypothetical protein